MKNFINKIIFIALLSMVTVWGQKSTHAVHIELEGTVDKSMVAYAQRAIKHALEQKPDHIIFEINSFGGELNAAYDIVDAITELKIPTTALVRQKAISAGSLIALACNKLYMLPSTTIGDCAPIIQGSDGPNIVGEKIQSPLRAKFRNLAQRNGYPEFLSESMVSTELEILELRRGDSVIIEKSAVFDAMPPEEQALWTKKILVHAGELLTMTDIEAVELGFSQATVESLEQLQQKLEIKSIAKIETTWSEKLAGFLAAISPLLMMLAFGAIYMEVQTPGFGIFGITGVVLLAIVFGGQYVSGLADKLPLVLLLLGAILIFVEILILPGTWISGLSGLAVIIIALIMVLKESTVAWKLPAWTGLDISALNYALFLVFGSAITALTIPFFFSKYVLTKLPPGFSPMHQSALEGLSPVVSETLNVQVGDVGVAVSVLRPGGKVQIGNLVVEAESPYKMLTPGVQVKVIEVEANHIKVVEVKDND